MTFERLLGLISRTVAIVVGSAFAIGVLMDTFPTLKSLFPSGEPSRSAPYIPSLHTPGDESLDLPILTAGKKDADAHMIVYSSPNCPTCTDLHKDTFPALDPDLHAGRVSYEIRLLAFAPPALHGARLVQCAKGEKKWQLLGKLFTHKFQWSQFKDRIPPFLKFAEKAGMDGNKAKTCLADKEAMDAIKIASGKWIERHDVRFTPTLLLDNGKVTMKKMGDPSAQEILEGLRRLLGPLSENTNHSEG